MEGVRRPFQGVSNVVRFNWHFYLFAVAVLFFLIAISFKTDGWLQLLAILALVCGLWLTLVSLVVTYWVYDLSSLYTLYWFEGIMLGAGDKIVNINAGFDETSALLQAKFPEAELLVLDFYNPAKHTEVSIKRARKVYPPYLGTVSVQTTSLPLADASVDCFVATLAAHEIRDNAERIAFFKEVNRVLKPNGRVVVTEHLRDTANYLAYNVGAFHFHSKETWVDNFQSSGFKVEREIKTTPFISTFILVKNGATS